MVWLLMLALLGTRGVFAAEGELDPFALLGQPSDTVRREAADEILALGDAAIPRLQGQLLPQAPILARWEAIRLLGRLQAGGATSDLVDLMKDRGSPRLLRAEAARALGMVGGPGVVDALLAELFELPGPVSHALVDLDRDETIPLLFEVLRSEARLRKELRTKERTLRLGRDLERGDLGPGWHDHGESREQAEDPGLTEDEKEIRFAEIARRHTRSAYDTVDVSWAICELGCNSGMIGITGRAQNCLGRFPADGLVRGLGFSNPIRLAAYCRFRQLGGVDVGLVTIPEEAKSDWASYQEFGSYNRARNWWENEKHRLNLIGVKREPSAELLGIVANWVSELQAGEETEAEGFLILMREIAFPEVFAALGRLSLGDLQATPLKRILYASPLATGEYAMRVLTDVVEETNQKIWALHVLSGLRELRALEAVRSLAFDIGEKNAPEQLRAAALDFLVVARDHDSLNRFVTCLSDSSSLIVERACRAVGSLADEESENARGKLSELMEGGEHPALRLAAASALLDQGSSRAVDFLIEQLDNRDLALRQIAIDRLRDAGGIYLGYDPASIDEVERLRTAMAWKNWWRSQMTEAAGVDRERLLALQYQRFPMRALSFLINEKAVRMQQDFGATIASWPGLPEKEAIRDQRVLNASASHLVKQTLRARDGSRANPLEFLIRRIDDENPLVRLGVAGGLGMSAEPDVVAHLVAMLKDSSRLVRVVVAEGLTEVALYGDLPVETRVGLRRKLSNLFELEKDAWVSTKLLETRLALMDGQAVGPLIELLGLAGSNATWLRDEVFQVLKSYTGQDFGFQASASDLAREAPLAQWEEWWQKASANREFKPLCPRETFDD